MKNLKVNVIGLAVAGVLGFSTSAVMAEEAYTGSWYAVPGVSVMHPDSELDADNTGPGGFIRLGKEISEHWDVQIGASYAEADEDTGIPGASGDYKQTIFGVDALYRSEEHTSELQSLMRISYAVFCLKKKTELRIQ